MLYNTIFKGIVEENQDPEMRNRLKIRVGEIHGSVAQGIPTQSLPWAEAVAPLVADPPIPKGTVVYVTFERGDKNYPLYLGYMIKKVKMSQCFKCIHLSGAKRCDAFPEEIPDEVYENNFIHNKIYSRDGISDNGIVFEKRE